MKRLDPDMTAALDGPATTLCECWRLTRADGLVLGFTDHDQPLTFEGTRFEPASGLSAGAAESELGLATSTREVAGALSGAAITAEDIRAGRYDGARVESFLTDWTSGGETRMLTGVHHLGEVRYGDIAFVAELRGRFADLDRVRGRLFRRRCDAVFGDERCGIDLQARGFLRQATAVSGAGHAIDLGEALPGDPSLFAAGTVTILSGPLSGLAREIAGARRLLGAGTRLSLTEALPDPIAGETQVRLARGCDKRFATCRDRFANGINFRGFPHMPGNDAALQVAKSDVAHDGRPLVP